MHWGATNWGVIDGQALGRGADLALLDFPRLLNYFHAKLVEYTKTDDLPALNRMLAWPDDPIDGDEEHVRAHWGEGSAAEAGQRAMMGVAPMFPPDDSAAPEAPQ